MQRPIKLQLIPVVCGALILMVIVLSGCGQKDATAPPATSPPALVAPVTPAAATPAAAAPPIGIKSNRTTLQAQSDYWRKHGQGLNETPTVKPKQSPAKQ